MTDIDKALRDEEEALLRRIEEDQGHLDQLAALIATRSGWVSVVLLATQLVFFIIGVWAGWNFFQAPDALSALHWGLSSAVLLVMALMLKLALWPAMQAEHQLQILKRIELGLGMRIKR